MQTVNSGMTNAVLTEILANQYGVQAPSNSNKQQLLELLAKNGCVVTPDETSETSESENAGNNVANTSGDAPKADGGKPKERRYIVNIFKQKDEKGDVLGCVNGKAFQLPRGKDIEISQAIYDVLTKGAVRIKGEPLEGGGLETYKEQAYPLTLVEIIE